MSFKKLNPNTPVDVRQYDSTCLAQECKNLLGISAGNGADWSILLEQFFNLVFDHQDPVKVAVEIATAIKTAHGERIRWYLRDLAVSVPSEDAAEAATMILAAMSGVNRVGILAFVALNSIHQSARETASRACDELISGGVVGPPVGTLGASGSGFTSISNVFSSAGEYGPGQTAGIFALLRQRDPLQLLDTQSVMSSGSEEGLQLN